MTLPECAERLRIFIGEDDRYDGKLLVDAIVMKAREEGLAGATVLKGVMGFGANSIVRSSKILRLSENMPLVIEIVDSPEKIEAFIPGLNEMIKEGLVTREQIQVTLYRHNPDK